MRNGNVVAAIAVAAALAGCSTTGEQRQSPVTSAQTEAERSLDQAREKQAQASDQQQKADEAEAGVRELERELAQAQTQAQEERRKAEAMQADAQRATERASERARTSQQEAAQAQQQERAELAQPSIAQGTLVRASDDRVTIEQDGEMIELSVSEAEVTLNGEQAEAAELPIGSEVRASYRPGQPLPQAESLEVTAPEEAFQPGMEEPAFPQEPGSEPYPGEDAEQPF